MWYVARKEFWLSGHLFSAELVLKIFFSTQHFPTCIRLPHIRIIANLAAVKETKGKEGFLMVIPLKVTLSNGKLVSSLYRIQLFAFNMFGVGGQAPEMVNEAPKHMKWEPTHFMGLSLKLNLRLPCLFQVLSV